MVHRAGEGEIVIIITGQPKGKTTKGGLTAKL